MKNSSAALWPHTLLVNALNSRLSFHFDEHENERPYEKPHSSVVAYIVYSVFHENRIRPCCHICFALRLATYLFRSKINKYKIIKTTNMNLKFISVATNVARLFSHALPDTSLGSHPSRDKNLLHFTPIACCVAWKTLSEMETRTLDIYLCIYIYIWWVSIITLIYALYAMMKDPFIIKAGPPKADSRDLLHTASRARQNRIRLCFRHISGFVLHKK